jgi:hypothetical protein
MHKAIRPRLTYANAMATIAVFVALGGASYAATQLPRHSVGAAQLKPDAVTAAKISAGALTAAGSWDASTYSMKKAILNNSPFELTTDSVFCDPGDPEIGGGFVGADPRVVARVEGSYPQKVIGSQPVQTGWSLTYKNAQPNISSNVTLIVRCADFAPAHVR